MDNPEEPEVMSQGFEFHPLYGWLCLGIGVAVFYYWNRIQEYLDARYERRQQQLYDAKCHKDPDWVKSHHEGLEIARRKMQQQYEAKAAEHMIKVKEKEEQKRLEKLAQLSESNKGGNRLGSKSDYNPLMGDSGGRYKPQKKSGCPGGGCS